MCYLSLVAPSCCTLLRAYLITTCQTAPPVYKMVSFHGGKQWIEKSSVTTYNIRACKVLVALVQTKPAKLTTFFIMALPIAQSNASRWAQLTSRW